MRFGNIYIHLAAKYLKPNWFLKQRLNVLIFGNLNGEELDLVTELPFEVKRGTNDLLFTNGLKPNICKLHLF